MNNSESRQGRHNLVCVRIHLVFRVRRGFPLIGDEMQPRLWAYIGGIAKHAGLKLYQVGGERDHAHVFFGLPSTLTVAQAVQKIKAKSSAWVRQQPNMSRFEWQEGYGAFSVSASHTEATMAYIQGQKEHHAKRDFEGELAEI